MSVGNNRGRSGIDDMWSMTLPEVCESYCAVTIFLQNER